MTKTKSTNSVKNLLFSAVYKQDLEDMIYCTFRHTFCSKTYMNETGVEIIRRYIKDISPRGSDFIIREMEKYFKENKYPDKYVEEPWKNLLKELQEALSKGEIGFIETIHNQLEIEENQECK